MTFSFSTLMSFYDVFILQIFGSGSPLDVPVSGLPSKRASKRVWRGSLVAFWVGSGLFALIVCRSGYAAAVDSCNIQYIHAFTG